MDYQNDSDGENHNENLLYELSTIAQQTLRQLSIASDLCQLENARRVKLENEYNELKKRKLHLEGEIISVKKKRWCCWCLQEAMYENKNHKNYCSSQCEQLECASLPKQ